MANHFSKWCEAYPVATIDVLEITKIFVENLVLHYGVLLELHTVQGRNFESNLFLEICTQLKINKTRTTALHPQLDEMVEWINRTVLQNFSKIFNEHQKDWNHYVPQFMLAYWSAIHDSIHHTPTKVIFGHELRLPCHLEFGTPSEKLTPVNEFVTEMRIRLRRIHTTVRNDWSKM